MCLPNKVVWKYTIVIIHTVNELKLLKCSTLKKYCYENNLIKKPSGTGDFSISYILPAEIKRTADHG